MTTQLKLFMESGERDYIQHNILNPISKDMDKINLTQFDGLGIPYSCSKNIDDAKDCDAQKYYMTLFTLNALEGGEGLDGYFCVAYYINYNINDTEIISQFEKDMYQYSMESKERLRQSFINCRPVEGYSG